jgi:hypothetical protein
MKEAKMTPNDCLAFVAVRREKMKKLTVALLALASLLIAGQAAAQAANSQADQLYCSGNPNVGGWCITKDDAGQITSGCMGDPVNTYHFPTPPNGQRLMLGLCMIKDDQNNFVFMAPRNGLGPSKIEAVPALIRCHIDMGRLVCGKDD